jgi:hypothetical protein
MDSSKINNWFTLIANVAVIAGIVFLAIEIRQNNELLRSESRQALISNDINSLTVNIEHADIFAKLVSGVELSSEDQLRISFMFTIDLRNREFEYSQYSKGLLDEDTWLSYRQVLLFNHSSGLGRKWWDEIGRELVNQEFASLIDELLVNAQPQDIYKPFATWANTKQP